MTDSPSVPPSETPGTVPLRVYRLLGNSVVLKPIAEPGASEGGILLTNKYRKPATLHRVYAVGPGKWLRRKGRPNRWIAPEVKPGDIVVSRHALDGSFHPDWIVQNIENESGDGQVVVDARWIMAVMQDEKT